MFYSPLAIFAFTVALASAQEANVDDNGSMDFLNQNRQSGDWSWPTFEMVFSEVVFPDYMVGLHRPYTPVIMPQGLKTGASTAAAIVDKRCAYRMENCFVGQESFGETLRLDQSFAQKRVRKSKGMFGDQFPFTGWTARSTVDPFLWEAVYGSEGHILTVIRDPVERVIAAWESYRNSRGVFDMELGEFIEKAYYDEEFRAKLALPQFTALDAMSRELVGKSVAYGTKGFAERFGERVAQKIISGDWLMMVADRFEESVYMYMRKAYGFEWHETLHPSPKYRSADELKSGLSMDQNFMLRELQPYDHLLYEAANVFLDTWMFRTLSFMEHTTMEMGRPEDDDHRGDAMPADDNTTSPNDDVISTMNHDDTTPPNDDIINTMNDDDHVADNGNATAPMEDNNNGESRHADFNKFDCDYFRWAVANWNLPAYFSYNSEMYNANYYSTGGYDQVSIEYCFMGHLQDDIKRTCAPKPPASATPPAENKGEEVKHEQRNFQQTHNQMQQAEAVPFLSYSKSARDMIKRLKANGKESGEAGRKLSRVFEKLTMEAKTTMEARKAGSANTSPVQHADSLGSSKDYYSNNLDEYEMKLCEFYEQNHHEMMSWSQRSHDVKVPEGMSSYIWNEVIVDYLD